MSYKMVAPPEVEEEGWRLYNVWINLPRKTRGTLEDYLKEHSSAAAKEYMRQYEEAHAMLQPGEYV